MGRVLIVFHSQSGNTRAAAEALANGARTVPETDVVVKEALEAGTHDLLSCDAVAVGTPDYFSYMAGGLKDFFDRTFYPTQGNVTDKPCGIFVTHGGGGRALESVKTICAAFKFKMVGEPMLVKKAPDASARKKLAHLGRLLAEAARAGGSGAEAAC
jgi:flavorubredoxin